MTEQTKGYSIIKEVIDPIILNTVKGPVCECGEPIGIMPYITGKCKHCGKEMEFPEVDTAHCECCGAIENELEDYKQKVQDAMNSIFSIAVHETDADAQLLQSFITAVNKELNLVN